MLLLVIDTETTGLDPKTDDLIEFAAALYSVDERAVLWSASAIVPSVEHNPIPEINGITDGMLKAAGFQVTGEALRPMFDLLDRYTLGGKPKVKITALCAHNANFDRSFLRASTEPLFADVRRVPWICTQTDIVYPRARGSQHLAHLAADHGLVAVQRHRALSDVLLLCDLLSCVDDLAEQVEAALKPRAAFEAIVSYADRELAKNLGFRWSIPPGRTKKCWWRMLPEDTPLEPTAERPFRLERIVEAD